MSSAHNLPGMVATPHFTKKIGELGLAIIDSVGKEKHQKLKEFSEELLKYTSF